jgi:histidinol-phosphatase (PHP family)
MPTADYHLHTPLCRHATGHPREYAQAALDRGLPEIGFSDHNPMPQPFDDWRMDLDEFPQYLDLIAETQAEFASSLPIKLGLEIDYLDGPDQRAWIEELSSKAEFDYLIGSVHYIAPGWAIDDPDPKWQNKWTDPQGVEDAWTAYWKLYTDAIRSGLFDILAHPDLPKKFGHRPGGDLRRFYEPAIEAARDAGIVFELSTAGLRKPCAEMYPARTFLELQHAAGIPLVISSDAHQPASVGHAFPDAIALAKEIGFTHTTQFTNRQPTPVPVPKS